MHRQLTPVIRRMPVLLVFTLLAALVTGCATPIAAQRPEDLAARKLRIVATTGMVADAVRNVAGERADVTALMGPGVDPHLYKASEGDVLRLGTADVVFYSGLHLEAKLGDVLERMGDRVRARAVTDGIEPSRLLSSAEYEGQYDPHVWFDVALWAQTIEAIHDTLVELDPGSAGLYRANADAYRQHLLDLDGYVRQQAARIPAPQRVLITAHDAFNYFGRAYGFEVRGLQGVSTVTEAGTGDVQALASFLAERQIRALFIESSVPVRNVEAVQAAVRARGFEVRIGGELFSDAMGSAGTVEGTYVGMVRHNIDTIVSALLGEQSATSNE
jgi:manganese/zinc/iron transport system substrate-binding protein